jgi:hypothetical protein
MMSGAREVVVPSGQLQCPQKRRETSVFWSVPSAVRVWE